MNYEYIVFGQTVSLDVDPSVVAVRFAPSSPNSSRALATAAAGIGPFSKRFELPGEGLTIVPVGLQALSPMGLPITTDSKSAINALNAQPTVQNALPVFRVDGNQVVPADRLIVGINDRFLRDALSTKFKITVLREFEDKVIYQIPDGSDPFQISREISAEAGVRFAEPDFITIGRHVPQRSTIESATMPVGVTVPRQYAMNITQAAEAWLIQRGDPKVRVAILDEGVDTEHPDLKSIIVGSFDAVEGDSYQEPNPWDGHGTACAGLAVATGSPHTGMVGAGKGCSLLAVRIAFSQFKGGPWITTNEKISQAVAWSWQNDASVLSNSWGGGAPSAAIIEEFEKARTLGRSGLGCIIVIAAGNSFSKVQFPANISNVVTVSASNEYDEAKTPTSRDGENWWGTCYGREIAVAAPGVHNLTTDISGTKGYSETNYTATFNGTSSSTPIVSGACALILSANPSLTEEQVREILSRSADKVGPYAYDDQGRNGFFGSGRINVLEAVKMAKVARVQA